MALKEFAGYPPEYYTQGLNTYSGQDNTAKGGILTGGLMRPLGSTLPFQTIVNPVQKLDILEAAKRKLIRILVKKTLADPVPEAYSCALLDLVRDYDSEWASFYDSLIDNYPIHYGTEWSKGRI